MTIKQLPLPPKSNKQVQEYITAIDKGYHSQFVRPVGKNWSIRHAATGEHGGTFPTREQAIIKAKKLAAAHNSEVIVFGKDGNITERIPTANGSL